MIIFSESFGFREPRFWSGIKSRWVFDLDLANLLFRC